MNQDFLNIKLADRAGNNSLRQLTITDPGMIDFCSNDYLGIATKGLLHTGEFAQPGHGSTGSRLLTGNYRLIEETEEMIAAFHDADAALIFNSGYDANLGLLSSVPQRGDTILYDYLSHASIRDGIRLSMAQSFSFQHNDLEDLEEKLNRASGNIFVVTESIFSMDGDRCPLKELIECCERFNANLVIDEAHATGILGERGEGLVQSMHMQHRVFAQIHTFGKALGCHGAVVLGSVKLRQYLINFARSFIYSTALPPVSVAHIRRSYEIFPGMTGERSHLNQLVQQFRSRLSGHAIVGDTAPVHAVIVQGNEQARAVSMSLKKQRLDVRPILYPTIPKGKERLRIVFHAFNTEMELDNLLNSLKNSL